MGRCSDGARSAIAERLDALDAALEQAAETDV